MNKIEKAKLESNGRVVNFITLHDATLILITLYAAIKSRFLANMTLLQDAIVKQATEIKMFAASKKIAKSNMTSCILKFALRAKLQAKALGKDTLAMSLDIKKSYIGSASAEDALARAKALEEIMSDNSAILTELTPADFTEMDKKIDQYADIVFTPKDEIKKRKMEGTAKIAAIQKDIDIDKEDIGELVLSYLPDLYASYQEAAKIGSRAGIRHTSLVIQVQDSLSGAPLRFVKCSITKGIATIIKKTTEKGFVRFYSLENALWNVKVEYEGYETFMQEEVGTNKRRIVALEIKLKKKPLSEIKTGSFLITALNAKNEKPMPGLKLKLEQASREYVSNDNGEFYEEMMICGECTGTISGDDVLTENVSFSVKEGSMTEITYFVEERES
jgi:hypothetical protein